MNTIYHYPIVIETICKNGSEKLGAKAVTSAAYDLNEKFITVEHFGKSKAEAERKLRKLLSADGRLPIIEISTKVLYVSGAISGIADLNKTKFYEAAKQLNSLGFRVINPHEICKGIPESQWNSCMRMCITHLMRCDQMIMLDDWRESQGAMIEYQLGYSLGMEPVDLELFIKNHDHENSNKSSNGTVEEKTDSFSV